MSKKYCTKTLLQTCKQTLLQSKIVTNACKQCKQKILNCNRNCNTQNPRQIGGFLHFVNNVTFFSYKLLKIEKLGIFIQPNFSNLPISIKLKEKIVTLFTSGKSAVRKWQRAKGQNKDCKSRKRQKRSIGIIGIAAGSIVGKWWMPALRVRDFGRHTREGCCHA